MNKILLTLAFMFSYVACIFAQRELPEETVDYAANFATFAGVVGVTAVVTEFIKKLFKVEPSEWVQRIISWVIGIGLKECLAGDSILECLKVWIGGKHSYGDLEQD